MTDPAHTADALNARIGTMLAGKYRLTRLLGVGGMGAVYEAENTWTERRVAIKLMIGPRSTEAEVVSRFLREARAASKIEHPNIVDVLDMGEDAADGTLFIVQEFLVGRDLGQLLQERTALKLREAMEYLVPIMAALVAAHAQGIVHRDLKPENMFITRTPQGVVPKLIDFGIAKITARGSFSPSITRTGETMGTPYYMSPEQARGEKEIDQQTDVWAMGAVWFEVLSGRTPFLGDSYNALLSQILTEPVPSLSGLVPSLPVDVAAVIQRSLARDRTVRFETSRLFLRALLECDLQAHDWFRALHAQYITLVGSEEYDNEQTAVVVHDESEGARVLAVAAIANASVDAEREARQPFSTTMSRTPRELEARATPAVTRSPAVIGMVSGLAIALVAASTFVILRVRDHGSRVDVTARPAVAVPPVQSAPPIVVAQPAVPAIPPVEPAIVPVVPHVAPHIARPAVDTQHTSHAVAAPHGTVTAPVATHPANPVLRPRRNYEY